ncbi:MAG: lactate utilization protein [Firmicutes bacterium]|nr:lactate utilization protein [Bacillota bacterium]
MSLIAQFEEKWQALAGQSWVVSHPDQAAAAIHTACQVLSGQDQPVIFSGPDSSNISQVSLAPWLNSEISLHDAQPDTDSTASLVQRIHQADVGITGCAWACAETGSVALYATPQSNTLLSIIPPAHLILIHRRQLLPTLSDGFSQLRRHLMQNNGQPPLVRLISGPSRTADIEGTLVVGVHGPGSVGAVILDWD